MDLFRSLIPISMHVIGYLLYLAVLTAMLHVLCYLKSMGIGRHGVCGASALSHVEGVPYNGVANVQTHHLNTEGAIAWEMLSNLNRVTQIPVQVHCVQNK